MDSERPQDNSGLEAAPNNPKGKEYVVVARRYRPRSFEELVGQQQVSKALANAINTNRVGHAYLFTGARGVGKTSTARILAKALNCATGPSPKPCNECEICQGIASGEDIDVLEIDGASNRGIDEIRQLRSNANIRPSRARYKIYIIDEVHMLTTPAFNALLKTLEEPPEHVKFMFCTTDPEKIPITVLSRCQRFDFAPIEADSILERLQFIVEAEHLEAETEALRLLARRAGGSMRDSQSLLEQLLSFCTGKITVNDVHSMLGTADTGRLFEIATTLVGRDAAGALEAVDRAVGEGVDVGQLTEQLLGYFRDIMAASVGCGAQTMLHSDESDHPKLLEMGKNLGLETVLAIVQILDQTLSRLRQSTYGRTLVEAALVRICKLEDLDQLPALIAQLSGSAPSSATSSSPRQQRTVVRSAERQNPSSAEKKTEKSTITDVSSPKTSVTSQKLSPQSVEPLWKQTLTRMEDMTADMALFYDRIAITAPNRLVVSFKAQYTLQKESCERPERKAKIEQALTETFGFPIRVDFELLPKESSASAKRVPPPSFRQRMREKEKHPLVSQAVELFEAELIRLDEPKQPAK